MSPEEWSGIKEQIKTKEKPSVLLSRSKMKEVLGFTTREHQEWIEDGDMGSGYKTSIHLDFYNEQKRIMFLLKYGNGQE